MFLQVTCSVRRIGEIEIPGFPMFSGSGQSAGAVRESDIHPKFHFIDGDLVLSLSWSYSKCQGEWLFLHVNN